MTKEYTKEDYLTATAYAKKHNLSVEIVQRAIKELRGVMFKKGIMNRPIIVKIGKEQSGSHICPDPGAQEIFQEKIKQIQNRGK